MSDNTVRLHDFIYAYIDDGGYGCFAWKPRAYTTEYVRSDVAQAQLDAANARIAELEAAQRWVSVDERLPDDEDNGVIAWTNNASEYSSYNFDLAFYHKNFGWLMATEWEHGDPTVTHWMPLPPPPVTDETHHR